MPKPACAKCGLFFRPEKNDVTVEECAPEKDPQGTETWKPYKIWSADLWKCRGCGAEIIVGWGREPITEHYQPSYARWRLLITHRIGDC